MDVEYKIPDSFYESEIRCGYEIFPEMKRVWGVQIELLFEVIKICKEHKLNYFAIGGTLLGAVRHSGYIPWDDDIDIAMPRADYNKFCAIASKELSYPFFLQTTQSDPFYFIRHAKLRNVKTTGILKSQMDSRYRFCQGIFIDIFPIDKLPNDSEVRNDYFNDLYETWGQVYKYAQLLNCDEKSLIHDGVSPELIRSKLYYYNESYEKLVVKYQNEDVENSCIFALMLLKDKKINNKWMFDNIDFCHTSFLPYEFFAIPVPSGYLNILKNTYGDWKKFIIGNSLHGDIIFDVDLAYTNYL